MTIVSALPFTLQNGTTADATQVMADFDQIRNDVNNNAAHNGINADITALTALTTPVTPAQGGSNVYVAATSTGTANAQVIASPTPNDFALTQGNRICFTAGFSNTTSLTLNVNGTGATVVVKRVAGGGLSGLSGGEVTVGTYIEAIYTGAAFELLTNVLENGGFGPPTTIAAATTTSIGLVTSHFAVISGAATITGFGAASDVAYPIYRFLFTGISVLTYNATSMILPGNSNITTAVGDSGVALYLGGTNWQVVDYTRANGQPLNFSSSFLQNYIAGLTLSTAGGSAGFGIATGEAADSTNAQVMLLGTALAKTTASWASGNGGSLDTGAIANSTWYSVFLIYRTDTGVADVVVSLSATSPTLPTNYTLFRRIGSMKTDGSAHWLAFTQNGNIFTWAAPSTDSNAVTSSASRVSLVLTVAPGVPVSAMFRAGINIGAGSSAATIFTSLLENDQAPNFGTICDLANVQNSYAGGSFERITNTSGQIGVRSVNTNSTVTVSTYGWRDWRGQ